jgi:uncharacterized metal-binding protein YceD (DUF177 family)
MNHRRAYDIAFVGLKTGIHEYVYEVDDQFFADYAAQDFRNCQATVKLSLEKNTGFLMLKFEIGGQLEVICDRCGNYLPLQLWDDFQVVVKMAEDPKTMNEQEEDPDVQYISRTESHINVSDWIYEFIVLSIPMQRMCSEEEMGGPHCNKEVLEKLKKLEDLKETEASPLWKGLEQFKQQGK